MQESKNILLILEDKLNTIGGVQKYNKALINIVKNNFKNINIDVFLPLFTEINEHEQYNEINNIYVNNFSIKNKYINQLLIPFYARHGIKEIIKQNNYNLVIDSTGIYFKYLSKLNNYFLIQHNSFEAYQFKLQKTFTSFLKRTIKILFGARFPFNKTKNIILFDEKNKEEYQKLFKNPNQNITCISLSSKYKSNIENIWNRKNIIFFGRFSNQKNIKELININNNINKIDFYGSTEQSKYSQDVFKILKENNWYKGVLNENNLYTTINKYKFSINYSLFEGFPFSVIESLACGVPVIIRDSFTSASFLTSYDKRLLIPKNATTKEAIQQINSLLNLNDEEYYKLCEKALRFFEENLSYEVFEKRWLEIFNKFLN